MTVHPSSSLLWIDDDNPLRYVNEQDTLEEDGWQVSWADGVEVAVTRLSKEPFLAILLDQALPMGDPLLDRVNVWQGCRLLHWLRGKPFPREAPQMPGWEKLGLLRPRKENRIAKVVLISAFYDPEVGQVLRAVEPDLLSVAKPIDAERLAEALRPSRRS